MRKITITLEDETTKEKVYMTTTLEQINDVYQASKIDTINLAVHQLNNELNKTINRNFEILIPKETKDGKINA